MGNLLKANHSHNFQTKTTTNTPTKTMFIPLTNFAGMVASLHFELNAAWKIKTNKTKKIQKLDWIKIICVGHIESKRTWIMAKSIMINEHVCCPWASCTWQIWYESIRHSRLFACGSWLQNCSQHQNHLVEEKNMQFFPIKKNSSNHFHLLMIRMTVTSFVKNSQIV